MNPTWYVSNSNYVISVRVDDGSALYKTAASWKLQPFSTFSIPQNTCLRFQSITSSLSWTSTASLTAYGTDLFSLQPIVNTTAVRIASCQNPQNVINLFRNGTVTVGRPQDIGNQTSIITARSALNRGSGLTSFRALINGTYVYILQGSVQGSPALLARPYSNTVGFQQAASFLLVQDPSLPNATATPNSTRALQPIPSILIALSTNGTFIVETVRRQPLPRTSRPAPGVVAGCVLGSCLSFANTSFAVSLGVFSPSFPWLPSQHLTRRRPQQPSRVT